MATLGQDEKREDLNTQEYETNINEVARAALNLKTRPFSKRMCQLYLMCLVPFFCSTLNGFDGSLMSSINAMPFYQRYFGLSGAGASTGITFAIYSVGSIASVPFAGPLNDYAGRKWGIFVGCAFVIIGTLIQAPSTNAGMFLGGRFILGLGVGFAQVAAPMLVAELSPPHYRGTITGLYNCLWYVGSILASWVAYGTQYLQSNNSWRIPLWCQLIFSALSISGVWFIPESPRWLMAHDRHEQAKAFLTKYHGEDDPNHPLVILQMYEMQAQISQEGFHNQQKWWNYSGLVNKRSARRRLICVVGMGFFGQYSGNAVISYFFPVVIGIAGIHSANTQLLLNALNPVFSLVAACCGAYLIERFGRRPLLLSTTACFPIIYLVMFGTSYVAVNQGSLGAAYVTIVACYLFGVIFSVGWTPLQALYPVECLPTETRAKGNAIQSLTSGIASFIGQYGGGTALGRISYWYYLFFVFWDMFEFAVIYWFFPETKERTLEELNDIFEAKNPVKASLIKRTANQLSHNIKRDDADDIS